MNSSQGECSKTCDGGVQTYERTKKVPRRYGGAQCKGNSTKNEPCNEQSCTGMLQFDILKEF